MKLSEEQLERYSRHLRIPGFDEEAQRKLIKASVLVVGAGGLGSPVALYLAAAGIGTIGIADFDCVERHNLQRQILFADDLVGHPKATSAKTRLVALNPEINVVVHEEGVKPENVRELFRQYDVIVDGSDNFDTRYLINDATFMEKKPLVYGSVFQTEGQVMVFNDSPETPCYRCLFPDPPEPGTVPSCDEAGVFGALCGIVGSMQVMETIKILTGFGKVSSGQLQKVDVFNNRYPSITLTKDHHCPLCGKNPSILSIEDQNYAVPCALPEAKETTETIELPLEVSVDEALMLSERADAVFLDVREPAEAQICQIENSLFIPMGHIPTQIESLPRDKPLLIYCHHGMRSLRVVHYLRSAGLENVTSLAGGINSWAMTVDPTMRRY